MQIEGILFTMDNCRYNNAKRNKQAIKTTYGNDIKIFEQTIPRTESLAETASEGVSIFAYDGKSKGADSYQRTGSGGVETCVDRKKRFSLPLMMSYWD